MWHAYTGDEYKMAVRLGRGEPAAPPTFTGGGGSFNTTGFTPAQSSYDFGAKLMFITKYNVTYPRTTTAN